jgi:hypothetical protein
MEPSGTPNIVGPSSKEIQMEVVNSVDSVEENSYDLDADTSPAEKKKRKRKAHKLSDRRRNV